MSILVLFFLWWAIGYIAWVIACILNHKRFNDYDGLMGIPLSLVLGPLIIGFILLYLAQRALDKRDKWNF